MPPTSASSLPVLMHHYINNYPNSIAVTPQRFAEHCRVAAEKGWRGVGLAEAEGFLIQGAPLPARSFLCTFDDGYLDNYFYALPVLHQYDHKGVMFAVTDRLEKSDAPRASVEALLSGTAPRLPGLDAPVVPGSLGYPERRDTFCNHGEIRAMDAHGTLAVAGHSAGHLGVYTGPEFTGFTMPGKQIRTFYLTSYGRVWGMPAFPVKPGLAHRAFLPEPELIAAIIALVPQDEAGAQAFFAEEAGCRALEALVAGFQGRMGRMETDAECRERMWREIYQGKADLEAILGHRIRTLCWPWGAFDGLALALGKEAGYEVFVTTREGVNPAGSAESVCRFKVKDKPASWLLSRLRLYANPLLGRVYAALRM